MRKIVSWPAKVLRTPAATVDAVTEEVSNVWEDMIKVMESVPGIGLAAPQVGVGLRLAVVDASDTRGQVIRMANPEILHASIEFNEYEEGSPCLKGVSAMIKRPRAVTVRYMDDKGIIVRKDLVGLWARSCQHQIDHLNGKMYFDNLSKLKRNMLLKKARKS